MTSTGKQTVGLLAPKGNTAIVEDFERLLPEDVDLRVGRLYRDGERTARERLFDMAAHIEEAVEELGKEPLDVVAFGCTGGSFIGGPGYDRDLASPDRLRLGRRSSRRDGYGCRRRAKRPRSQTRLGLIPLLGRLGVCERYPSTVLRGRRLRDSGDRRHRGGGVAYHGVGSRNSNMGRPSGVRRGVH